MKKYVALVSLALSIAQAAFAQEVKRCDGPGGKITYAEICPSQTQQSTVTRKGLVVTQTDKNQRAMEAGHSKRSAAPAKTNPKPSAESSDSTAKKKSTP
jgi:hypothetical protein